MMTNKEKVTHFMLFVYLGFVALLICMQCDINLFYNGDCGIDSGVFRYMAYAASQGEVWYRDSFDHKGPLIYLYNQLGMSLSYWRGIWVVEYLSMLVTVIAAYKTARLVCSRLMACGSLLIVFTALFRCFEGGNLVEEYALPFIMVSLYIFLDYFLYERISWMRLIICGFCFGGVCLLRPNMIAVWCIFCLAVLIQNIYRRTLWKVGKFIIFFLVGMLVIVGPFVIYLMKIDALESCIECYLTFNFTYVNAGSRAQIFVNMGNTLKNQVMLLSLMVILYQCVKAEKRWFYFAYVGCIVLSAYMAYMSGLGQVNSHYAMIIIPLYVFPIALFLNYCEKKVVIDKTNFILLLTVVITFPVWFDSAERIITSLNNPNGRDINIQVIVDEVEANSTEEDRITVVGNRDIIYVLSRRLSASRYSFQDPIAEKSPEILKEYLEDLEASQPALVIFMGENEMNEKVMPFVEENGYELIYENEGFDYLIYKAK